MKPLPAPAVFENTPVRPSSGSRAMGAINKSVYRSWAVRHRLIDRAGQRTTSLRRLAAAAESLSGAGCLR
jgi:hypothetical protein